MSDEELDSGQPVGRNYNVPYSLIDPNTSYNFRYGQAFRVALEPLLSQFQETYDNQGRLKQSQFRNEKGQYGTNIVSGGRFETELVKNISNALTPIIRMALLTNYDRMVGSASEHTGQLRMSVQNGTFESLQSTIGNYKFTFNLQDRTRTRKARMFGKSGNASVSPNNSTLKYGQVIFKGRGAIESGSKMVFPRYGNTSGRPGIFTRRVRGVPPQNIFALNNTQVTAMKMAIVPVIKSHILSKVKASKE